MTREEFIKQEGLEKYLHEIRDMIIHVKDNDEHPEGEEIHITTHFRGIPIWPEFDMNAYMFSNDNLTLKYKTTIRFERDNVWYLSNIMVRHESKIVKEVVHPLSQYKEVTHLVFQRLTYDVHMAQVLTRVDDWQNYVDELGYAVIIPDPNQIDEVKRMEYLIK